MGQMRRSLVRYGGEAHLRRGQEPIFKRRRPEKPGRPGSTGSVTAEAAREGGLPRSIHDLQLRDHVTIFFTKDSAPNHGRSSPN